MARPVAGGEDAELAPDIHGLGECRMSSSSLIGHGVKGEGGRNERYRCLLVRFFRTTARDEAAAFEQAAATNESEAAALRAEVERLQGLLDAEKAGHEEELRRGAGLGDQLQTAYQEKLALEEEIEALKASATAAEKGKGEEEMDSAAPSAGTPKEVGLVPAELLAAAMAAGAGVTAFIAALLIQRKSEKAAAPPTDGGTAGSSGVPSERVTVPRILFRPDAGPSSAVLGSPGGGATAPRPRFLGRAASSAPARMSIGAEYSIGVRGALASSGGGLSKEMWFRWQSGLIWAVAQALWFCRVAASCNVGGAI
ncbi:uncharacterized protein C2845_PM06G01110 [Panicum miliaceum]|uniref:Uncharacterized protein n=1 Tax=Panicum miliaceum TaxID=4540 RepID=A0A3L6RBH0_PANMI|nr:uncharacterized protein C2845_PM06G01110 [Panicum miliaceum]